MPNGISGNTWTTASITSRIRALIFGAGYRASLQHQGMAKLRRPSQHQRAIDAAFSQPVLDQNHISLQGAKRDGWRRAGLGYWRWRFRLRFAGVIRRKLPLCAWRSQCGWGLRIGKRVGWRSCGIGGRIISG